MVNARTIKLSNGIDMPLLGLGTTHNGGYNHETVVYAISECGYRLIDTAKRYGVESFLGQAIIDSAIPREEMFLTTKLWPTDYNNVWNACQDSTDRLNTDYLDLYLMHWPIDDKSLMESAWRSMELLYEADKVRAIGVSNFNETQLYDLMENSSIVPHVNQCEFHPYIIQNDIRHMCHQYNIQFQGYCPLGKGMLLTDPSVIRWAKYYRVSAAQILLKWSVQQGVITIPKSTKKARVLENSQIYEEFHLDDLAMRELNKLHIGNCHKRVINLQNMTMKLKSDVKPDGYKLKLATSNIFPTHYGK